jgi:TQXA domain-containing protein
LTAGALLALAAVISPSAAWADATVGGSVWIGSREGYGGTGAFPIFSQTPADPSQPGAPDYWAYCIEHDVTPETWINGQVGELSSYLGVNYFVDPAVQAKVLWVLAHSYPAVELAEFGTAAGVPGIARNDALEATQYAIWRYTELTFDAPWSWETPDSEAAYWYLIDGANASGGMTPADFTTTVSITPPADTQKTGSLVGPFVVHTNRPTASVSVSPAVALVDANGDPVDPAAVSDGQELYLDLRGAATAGAATITASVTGSSAMGRVISVPTTAGGMPTAQDHAQTVILVAPDTAQTTATADARWAADAQLAATGVEPLSAWLALALLTLGAGVAIASRRRAAP